MGYQSQEGHIGFKRQAAEGVFEDPGAVAPNEGVFMRTRGGALGANRELLIPDPEIGGNRDTPDAVMGTASFSGDIEFYARMQSLSTLFHTAFGSSSTGTTGVTEGVDQVGTHTITPLDSATTMPWLSIEEDIAGTLETFRYTDAVVNSISLECEPNGYFMGSAGIIAKTQLAGVTKTATPGVDTTPLLVGTSMTVTIGGLTTYIVRDFSMEFNNNFEDDVFELGSVALADLTAKRRELGCSFTIRPEDINLWREAVYGSAGATSVQSGAAAQKAVNISIDSFADVGTGVSDKYNFTLDVPAMTIQPFNLEPNGDDVIEFGLELTALRPDPGVAPYTVTIVNELDEVR